MTAKLVLVAAPAAALMLAACGGGQEIPVTNAGNVVSNQTQGDIAFSNDEPILQDQPVVNGSDIPQNLSRDERVIADPAASGFATSRSTRETLDADAAAARNTN